MARRTASAPTTPLGRRAALASVALAAAAVLTACGAAEHPGAAAVIGDHRITTAALETHVTAYRTALAARAPGSTEGKGLVPHLLQELVEAQLVNDELAARGLSVSPEEVQQEHAAVAGRLGGEARLEQAFLSQLGLAPSDMDTYFRMVVGERKLVAATGVDPSSAQAGTAVDGILAAAARRFAVSVNPRYGTWDARTARVAALDRPWLKITPDTTA